MRPSILTLLLVPALLLGACSTQSEPVDSDNTTSQAASDESPVGDPTAAAEAARADLAARLGVDAGDIAVESTEPREWTDSCLGLGGPAESCLQAITPGYAMVLMYNDTEYRYRTDERGNSVRAEIE
jgi:hypothetical protein